MLLKLWEEGTEHQNSNYLVLDSTQNTQYINLKKTIQGNRNIKWLTFKILSTSDIILFRTSYLVQYKKINLGIHRKPKHKTNQLSDTGTRETSTTTVTQKSLPPTRVIFTSKIIRNFYNDNDKRKEEIIPPFIIYTLWKYLQVISVISKIFRNKTYYQYLSRDFRLLGIQDYNSKQYPLLRISFSIVNKIRNSIRKDSIRKFYNTWTQQKYMNNSKQCPKTETSHYSVLKNHLISVTDI